jgi:hypothetical protein
MHRHRRSCSGCDSSEYERDALDPMAQRPVAGCRLLNADVTVHEQRRGVYLASTPQSAPTCF